MDWSETMLSAHYIDLNSFDGSEIGNTLWSCPEKLGSGRNQRTMLCDTLDQARFVSHCFQLSDTVASCSVGFQRL